MRALLLVAAVLLAVPLGANAPPAPTEGAVGAARQQYESGHFPDAVATLEQAIRSDSSDAALYYWLGRSLYELRKYDQASNQIQKAVKLDGQESDYHLWLGRTYGRLADARHSFWLGIKTRKELERAVELDPKSIAARRDVAEFYTVAPWIVGGGKKKAEAEIAAIAELDAVQGALAQAEYDRQTGNTTGAETEYQRALVEEPTGVAEYYEVADHYASRNNAAEMIPAVEGAARIDPNDPRLGYYRGVILAIEGERLTESESYLKAYLATTVNRSDYPPHADARTWLGRVYERLGRRIEAAEQYRQALETDPDSIFAKQSLKRLAKQRGN